MRFCIPKDLRSHFKRKQFKISLKSGNYKECKRLSLYLNDFIKEIYQDIRMSKKKLTFEEVKSILKIEVDKSVLHIQHIETGTGTTENQVLQSLQHITKEETQFNRTLEDDRKKVENNVDREMSKILKSNGFEVDKNSLEFKTLRKRVIELKLLRFSHKKGFVPYYLVFGKSSKQLESWFADENEYYRQQSLWLQAMPPKEESKIEIKIKTDSDDS